MTAVAYEKERQSTPQAKVVDGCMLNIQELIDAYEE